MQPDDLIMRVLPRSFYARDTVFVAKELLGKILVRRTSEGDILAKIVEAEAYRGNDDPASHAYRGKTPRNELMFGKAGFVYVYFIYGNHYCLNVTTERKGIPGAVLIRGVEVIDGVELAHKNRRPSSWVNLSNGPGKLTQALDITRKQNGLDITKTKELFISYPKINEIFDTITARRVGIKLGSEKPWRFYVKNNKHVSKP